MHALACQKCGAGLPPRDRYGNAWCASCGTGHHAPPEESAVALAPRAAPDAARIPMTDEAILALLLRHFADDHAMLLAPAIPSDEEAAAREAYEAYLPADERVLALYAGEHVTFLVTKNRLCWRDAAGRARHVTWLALDPDALGLEDDELHVGAATFYVLAFSARGAAARPSAAPTTPPPPHAISYHAYAVHASSQTPPSYACWQCTSPLHWNTPRCARCGASPSAEGWRRTA